MRSQPALVMLVLLVFFGSCTKDNPTPSESPTEIFNTVWSDFDKNYPYFTHKQVNWDPVYEIYSGRVTDETNASELAEVIGEMTMELRDIHVRFSTSFSVYHYSKRDLYPANPPSNAGNYLENKIIDNGIAVVSDISQTPFTYLRLKNFTGSSIEYEKVADTLDMLESKEGLVIDLRDNGGGNELNGRIIAGRFVDQQTLYKLTRLRNGPDWDDFSSWNNSYLDPGVRVNFNGPIVVLTNRRVYSSAELFGLMLAQYPDVVFVGDTTGAASANPAKKTLSNGWTYYISTWQAAWPDQTLIEDIGIAPQHYVLMDSSSIAAGQDLILEKGIEVLESY